MGRKKLNMEMINSKKTTNRTYNNRKLGILKKASELSTLCDVEVGVIIFGSSKEDEAPQVWPKEPEKLNNVIRRYLNTGIDERRKRATNVASFVKQEDQEPPRFESKKEKNNLIWDERIDGFSFEKMVDLANYLDSKIGAVDERIQMVKQKQSNAVQSCGGAEQGKNMNMMKMMMDLPAFGYESYDHQRAAHELILMKNSMMMNGYGLNYGCSPINVDVDDYTGLLGMQGNENYGNFNLAGGDLRGNVMNQVGIYNPNPNPMMAWDPNHDLAQLQMLQAQHQQVNGYQLHF